MAKSVKKSSMPYRFNASIPVTVSGPDLRRCSARLSLLDLRTLSFDEG